MIRTVRIVCLPNERMGRLTITREIKNRPEHKSRVKSHLVVFAERRKIFHVCVLSVIRTPAICYRCYRPGVSKMMEKKYGGVQGSVLSHQGVFHFLLF